MLFARAPPPDAPYWPGRRWVAAVDAVAWPGMACFALLGGVDSGGLIVALMMALLVISAARRLFTALLANNRYRFTTWRWARVLAWIAMIGTLLRVTLPG